jgi:TetR/AcrR family transcriptional regulator, fatty acid metabolism regulator protein
MDEIAARVGIAKGTVYLHFPGKEALIIKIFIREMERFLQKAEEVFASKQTARERLSTLLRYMYIDIHRKRSQLLSSAYNGVDLKRLLSENGYPTYELWERLAAIVTTLLEEGKAAGDINPVLPTQVMLVAFFSLLSPHVSERLIFNEDEGKASLSTEDVVEYLGSIFFDGVMAKK